MASVILGYWNVRSMAQPIRTLLEYAGVQFEDKVYDFDLSDPTDRARAVAAWTRDKTGSPSMIGGDGEEPMDFPNLPYYIETRADGSKLKLTQSNAILRYLARKFDLVVHNEDEIAKMDLCEQQLVDLKAAIVGYCYDNPMIIRRYPDYPANVKTYFYRQWEKFLSEKQWLMGDKLTYVDFMFWECIDWHTYLIDDFLDDLPNMRAYYQRFKDLPNIKSYMESTRFKAWPLVSPMGRTFGWIKKQE